MITKKISEIRKTSLFTISTDSCKKQIRVAIRIEIITIEMNQEVVKSLKRIPKSSIENMKIAMNLTIKN